MAGESTLRPESPGRELAGKAERSDRRRRPIAVMSFDRPHYLERVLSSLRSQTVPISSEDIFLFQDGYRSANGTDITDPRLIERCVALFEQIFPGAEAFVSTENLGVALNFARSENYFFEKLNAE